MVWHHNNKSANNLVRHVVDSHQWNFVEARWPKFAMEPRNVCLGMAIDGVNPFGDKRSTWSTWPMILINYNVRLWLSTKKHFMMLSLIILGPRLVISEHFDTYLELLVEDFKDVMGGWDQCAGCWVIQAGTNIQHVCHIIKDNA